MGRPAFATLPAIARIARTMQARRYLWAHRPNLRPSDGAQVGGANGCVMLVTGSNRLCTAVHAPSLAHHPSPNATGYLEEIWNLLGGEGDIFFDLVSIYSTVIGVS